MARGLFAGRKLKEDRKRFRFSKKGERSRKLKIYKEYDPLEGAPQARAIVLKKVTKEVKQPHSGQRKCAVVQLIKNSKTVTAYIPGNLAQKYVSEHDEVLIERIGGPKRGSMGDIPGVKFRIIKVNGVALSQLLAGKKEKRGK